MMRSRLLLGFCAAAALLLATEDANAAWIKVETVTIDGVKNALPSGSSIHRDYTQGGLYLFQLGIDSVGISYGKKQGIPPTVSASVMVLSNASGEGRFHSYGLSVDPGPQSFVYGGLPGEDIGVEYFIEDPNPSGNSGRVNVTVFHWGN